MIRFRVRPDGRDWPDIACETDELAHRRAQLFAQCDVGRQSWDVIDAATGRRVARYQRFGDTVERVPEDNELAPSYED